VQPAQKAYLQKYVDSFETALNGTNFQDPEAGFRRFVNDSSFIDFFIMSEISKNMDSYRFSTYFYKKRGGKIQAMPVWDFDRAWRNDAACNTFLPTSYIYKDVNGCGGRIVSWWWAKLLQDTKYKQDLVCRYNSLRQSTLSLQHLYNIIDSCAAALNSGAQQRNFIRWNILGKYVERNAKPYAPTYAIEIDTLKQWIGKRLDWLDADLGPCTASQPLTKNITSVKSYLENDKETINNIYPSPFKDQLSVALNLSQGQHVTIQLVDINGKVVYQKQHTLPEGAQTIHLNLKERSLVSGIYVLHINGTNINVVKKLVKE
jgi:hypothetical protein